MSEKERVMKFAIAPLMLIFALAACETVEGAGEDIENAGQTLSEEAQETQNEM